MIGSCRGNDRLEVVDDHQALLGEGPVWDGHQLVWVDILGGAVRTYDPLTGERCSFDVGQPVGAVAPRRDGGVVLAVRDGFALLDLASGAVEVVAQIESDGSTRMNDGSCDPSGRFWAGTMRFDEGPHGGALYCLDTNRQVSRHLDDVTISNGIDFSADGATMLYVDSPTEGVDAFDVDASNGTISNRRRLIDIDGPGVPDGMTVDANGDVWVAMWLGGCVRRYSPTGVLVETVDLPVSKVTSCAFGGEHLDDLYITTARVGLGGAELVRQPLAGALFRYRPRNGARGRAAHSYAG